MRLYYEPGLELYFGHVLAVFVRSLVGSASKPPPNECIGDALHSASGARRYYLICRCRFPCCAGIIPGHQFVLLLGCAVQIAGFRPLVPLGRVYCNHSRHTGCARCNPGHLTVGGRISCYCLTTSQIISSATLGVEEAPFRISSSDQFYVILPYQYSHVGYPQRLERAL